MKTTIYSFTVFLFLCSRSVACINGYWLSDSFTLLYEERNNLGHVPYGHDISKINFSRHLSELDSKWKATAKVEYRSDYGILLILQGKYQEARDLYIEIEEAHPGFYSTASNLGTAYELLGENKLALQWIKRSLEIDSSSHWDSEWIHIAILEAKIKGEKFMNGNFLLKTNFGTEDKPKSKLSTEALQDMRQQLYYQLNERITFVKPKDKVVGILLFELANLNFILGDLKDAWTDYCMAQKYGHSGQLLEKRIELTKKQLDAIAKESEKHVVSTKASQALLVAQSGITAERKGIEKNSMVWIPVLSLVVGLIGVGIVVYMKRKRKKIEKL